MGSSVERALFAGAHFDRRKDGKLMEMFKNSDHQNTMLEKSIVSVLDFFGSTKEPSEDKRRRKFPPMENSSKENKLNPTSTTVKSKSTGVGGQQDEFESLQDIKEEKSSSAGLRQKVSLFKPKSKPQQVKSTGGVAAEESKIEVSALLRKKYKIHVSGQDVPQPMENFGELSTKYKCRKFILQNLMDAGYREPTPIQRQIIPALLEGRECFACAPTGSGKTMAFLIPILMSLKTPSTKGVRAVILCPTRELALQTGRELRKLTKGKRFKCRLMTKSTAACVDFNLSPCDVLISTPLRLMHVWQEGKIDLSWVQHLVLDESDKLFEMGFVEQIDGIMAACTNPSVVRSLFSATLPEAVEELARTVMLDPIRIVIGERNSASDSVKQELKFVGSEEGKLLAIRQMFQEGLKSPILVFVQSKERAKQLYQELAFDGVMADVIHADRTQSQREAVLDAFRGGQVWVLIATDVMARGIDFKGVACVVNYDFPQSIAAYIHRIGRSGRAGMPGQAVTFYTEEDSPLLRSIANCMAASGCAVPQWMLSLPKQRLRGSRKLHVPHRHDISQAAMAERQKKKRKLEMIEGSKRRKAKQAALAGGGASEGKLEEAEA